MSVEVMLAALLTISTLSSLVAEAVKKILKEHNKEYKPNTLVGICAFVVAIIAAILYFVITTTVFTAQSIAGIIALALLSWLCAMVGYDKVVQAFSQFNSKGE